MILNIQESITSMDSLRNGYIIRDGFVFTKTTHAPVFDSLVIRDTQNAVSSSVMFPASSRSLDQHIQLVQEYNLEKAVIICNDLSFVTRCPSLKSIAVYPAIDSKDGFDFSALYQMPNISEIFCATNYGYKDQLHSMVDYSRMNSLLCVRAAGNGHFGYERIGCLEKLWLSCSKQHNDFTDISCSASLKDVTIMQCKVKSLKGIEKHPKLEELALYHCRSLEDISALAHTSQTLRSLTIESCPQITDFSVLKNLSQLQHLQLYGNNVLPDLNFLQSMKRLKTFCFTMNVQDGDLTLCTKIPYASCKNRKHYNFKDKMLPKNLSELRDKGDNR